jgi:hypothetical protein
MYRKPAELAWSQVIKYLYKSDRGCQVIKIYSFLRRVHITRGRQACARRETRQAFTWARKSLSTLLQLLARLRRVRIRIFINMP